MDYSIQQLTLIHSSIHSSVYYKPGGAREQPVIKVLNSKHLPSKRGLPALTVPEVLQDATGNGVVAAIASALLPDGAG